MVRTGFPIYFAELQMTQHCGFHEYTDYKQSSDTVSCTLDRGGLTVIESRTVSPPTLHAAHRTKHMKARSTWKVTSCQGRQDYCQLFCQLYGLVLNPRQN
jgi:hypothetical protein